MIREDDEEKDEKSPEDIYKEFFEVRLEGPEKIKSTAKSLDVDIILSLKKKPEGSSSGLLEETIEGSPFNVAIVNSDGLVSEEYSELDEDTKKVKRIVYDEYIEPDQLYSVLDNGGLHLGKYSIIINPGVKPRDHTLDVYIYTNNSDKPIAAPVEYVIYVEEKQKNPKKSSP